MQNRTAKLLLLGYILLFVWAGISPYSRATWYAENIPIVMIAVSLVVLYVRGFVFTPISYALMAVLLYLHTIGGHYTFERVPFGFVTNLFGFHRITSTASDTSASDSMRSPSPKPSSGPGRFAAVSCCFSFRSSPSGSSP